MPGAPIEANIARRLKPSPTVDAQPAIRAGMVSGSLAWKAR
jgi:hypothetical protein